MMMSYMYSLLNYVTATSKEPHESPSAPLATSFDNSSAYLVVQAFERGPNCLSDDQRRKVGINVISVVTKLALEFETEEVNNPFQRRFYAYLAKGHTFNRVDAAPTSAKCGTSC